MVLSTPVSQAFQSDSHRTGFAFRIGVLPSFRFYPPMQAPLVAMVGFALHTRETLPLRNMCADIAFRNGGFERRGQAERSPPCRMVTTALPPTLPLKAITPSAGATMAS